jgi:hypothetical protein
MWSTEALADSDDASNPDSEALQASLDYAEALEGGLRDAIDDAEKEPAEEVSQTLPAKSQSVAQSVAPTTAMSDDAKTALVAPAKAAPPKYVSRTAEEKEFEKELQKLDTEPVKGASSSEEESEDQEVQEESEEITTKENEIIENLLFEMKGEVREETTPIFNAVLSSIYKCYAQQKRTREGDVLDVLDLLQSPGKVAKGGGRVINVLESQQLDSETETNSSDGEESDTEDPYEVVTPQLTCRSTDTPAMSPNHLNTEVTKVEQKPEQEDPDYIKKWAGQMAPTTPDVYSSARFVPSAAAGRSPLLRGVCNACKSIDRAIDRKPAKEKINLKCKLTTMSPEDKVYKLKRGTTKSSNQKMGDNQKE